MGDGGASRGSMRAAPAAQYRSPARAARHRAGQASARANAPRAPPCPAPLRTLARAGIGAVMTELDPERLLRSLVDHGVEFCVIGAVAAWLQGNPTVTLDVDVMPR